MIRDLSETLKAMLTQPALPAELASAQIAFERPAEPFNPTQTTIDVYLYDVRENLELRNSEPFIDRQAGVAVIQAPPRRIICSYMITAWAVGGADPALQEHRLLTQVLRVLARYPFIPTDLARGSIKTSDPPVPLQVAVGATLTGISEFWSALGSKLRASLTVQATLALPLFDDVKAPLAVTHRIVTGAREEFPATTLEPASREEKYTVYGRVLNADGKPVQGADVLLVEKALHATTGSDGAFRLGPLPGGTFTFRASAGAATGQIQRDVPVKNGNYDIQLA